MRVLIVGAGAIGGVLAVRLAAAGHTVEILARPGTAEALTKSGLRVTGAFGTHSLKLPVHASPPMAGFDLIVLAMKTQDLPAAAREVARIIRGDIPVVTVQNGLRADSIAAEFVSPARVVGAVVVFDAVSLEPGRIHVPRKGKLLLGQPFSGAANRERVRVAASILGSAVPVQVVGDLRACRWTKLIVNIGNALPAITGLSVQECFAHRGLSRVGARALREGVRAAVAGGERLAPLPWVRPRLLRFIAWLPDGLAAWVLRFRVRRVLGKEPVVGSTFQSVARGKDTEVDFLNGAVVEAGALAHVMTPVNAALVVMVHEVEVRGEFFTPDEVVSRIMGAS